MHTPTIFHRMNGRGVLLLLTLLAMAACATAPATPRGTAVPLPSPAEGSARLVFLRVHDSKLYLLRNAPVYLDDQKIADIPRGGWSQHEVSPAKYRLTVRNWDSPGHCEVVIDAKAGATYYLQVDPRNESFGAFFAGDMAGAVAGANAYVALTTGLAAQAAESYGQACGGLFRLYPVDEASAQAKLTLLERVTD